MNEILLEREQSEQILSGGEVKEDVMNKIVSPELYLFNLFLGGFYSRSFYS